MLEHPRHWETKFGSNDVSDMPHFLPPIDFLLTSKFSSRSTLIFRLLRRALDLYQINPISEDAVLRIAFSNTEEEELCIMEHIWFLM